jgi:hypothetical protein
VGRPHKKRGKKNKKIKISSPSVKQGTRGRGPSPSARDKALGEEVSSPSACSRHSGKMFSIFFANGSMHRRRQILNSFCECPLPRVLLSGKMTFPECHGLRDTRERPSSPSAYLPRVQHSGKIGFPECPIFGSRGSSGHSENYSSPVVRDCY